MNIIRWVGAAGLLVLAGAATASPPPPQEDDGVYLDVEKKETLDRIARYRDAQEWKHLFDTYQNIVATKAQKLVQPDPSVPRWVGLVEWLNREFASLPPEALSYYRGQFDGVARLEFQKARAANRREDLARIVNEYFYSTVADEAMDYLAATHLEEGRVQEAVFYWRRLLENYPDSRIPKVVTAARIAQAAERWGNPVLLDWVRTHVKEKGLQGSILVGGVMTPLADYLASVRIEVPATAAAKPAVKLPSVPEPGDRFVRRTAGVRNDVKRWSYDLTKELLSQPMPDRRRGPMPQNPAGNLSNGQEYPFFPAFANVNGRRFVVFTNGVRVMAIDPSKVGTNPARDREGIYWKYPDGDPLKIQWPQNHMGTRVNMPRMGVTIDGEHAFVTLYSEKRTPAAAGGPMQDPFVGAAQLACFHVRTGRLLWSTDKEDLLPAYRKMEFWERNFTFCGSPLVRGDRVYVGLATSPFGEQESRVLCIDRRTGRPIWDRFLCSVSVTRPMWWGGGTLNMLNTVLTEDRGTLYVGTNLGAVAALDAMSGQVSWLTRYTRSLSGRVDPRRGEVNSREVRPANPLFLHDRRLWVLPQDAHDLMTFDLSTGAPRALPEFRFGAPGQELKWSKVRWLVGFVNSWMVLSGDDTDVGNLAEEAEGKDVRLFRLPGFNLAQSGQGAIVGDQVYLPCGPSHGFTQGSLSILGSPSWRLVETQGPWKDAFEYGNLIVADNYLIVASSRLAIYTDVETIRAEFVQRLRQDPPSAAAWLEHGDIMDANGRLVEAAESYLAFVNAAEGDPAHEGKVRDVKTRLHANFIERGKDAALGEEPGRLETAAEHFRMAKGFAWDETTRADAGRRLAEVLERLAAKVEDPLEKRAHARRAVEQYQELVERSREAFFRPEGSDVWVKVRRHASTRITALVGQYGPEAYATVEREARSELNRAAGAEALRAVLERYPDSRAATEALTKLTALYSAESRWDRVLSTLREMRAQYPAMWSPELQLAVFDALLQVGDRDRLEVELRDWGPPYKDRKVRDGGAEVAWPAAVAARAEALKRNPPSAPPVLSFPLNPRGTLESGAGDEADRRPPVMALEGDAAAVPIFGLPRSRDLELVARGSTVELWNVREGKLLWTARHPGGWFGATFAEGAGGVRLIDVFRGSPAEAAGLKRDDVIVGVNGQAARVDTFDKETGRPAGTTIAIEYRRAGKAAKAEAKLADWPRSARPAVMGAAWTRDYRLAVVWEDAVVSLDASTGAPGWEFRGLRDRFSIHRVHAMDGRILLHEHAPLDRGRSPFRTYVEEGPAKGQLPPADSFSRILCLDDSTGELAWARSLALDGNAAREHHQARFFAEYFDESVAVLSVGFSAGVKAWELQSFSAAHGGDVRRKVFLGSTIAAWTADPASGVLWVVDASSNNARILRNYAYRAGGDASFKTVSLQLDGRLLDSTQRNTWLAMAASPERVVIVAPPAANQPPNAMKLVVVPVADAAKAYTLGAADAFGKERALPPVPPGEYRQLPGLVTLGEDGTIYLYNEARAKTGTAPPAERRAYLTAMKTSPGKFEILWDAVIPSIRSLGDRGTLMDVHVQPQAVVVTIPRALMPGETVETSAVVVLSRKDGGYVERLERDLAIPATVEAPDPTRGSRLLLPTKKGLMVVGE